MSIIECILITLEYILTTLFDILKSPPLLIGIITMLGLILQKSPAGNVVKGTVKAMLGFVVLQGGAGLIVQSLDAFGTMFQAAFSLQGVVPNNEAITSIALKDLGQTTALIMVFGMLINILVARFTPMKYIFLTGHHTLFMAALFAAVLNTISLPAVLEDYGPAITVAIGSILLGFVMAFFPFLAQGTEGTDVLEPLRDRPVFVDPAKKAVFIFLPERLGELNVIRQYYPTGLLREFKRSTDGQLLFVSYEAN